MVAETEVLSDPGKDGFICDIQRLVAYFYAYCGLLISTQATRLQQVFKVLTDLFDQVGQRTNLVNMVSMAWQLCHEIGGHSMEAYSRRMKGEGITHR